MLPFITTNNYAIEQAAAQFNSDTLPSELTDPTTPPPTGEVRHRSESDRIFRHYDPTSQHQHDPHTARVHRHDRNDTVTQQSVSDAERIKRRRHHHRSIDLGQCQHVPAPVAQEVHEEDRRKAHTTDSIAEAKGVRTSIDSEWAEWANMVQTQGVMDRFRAATHIGGSEHQVQEDHLTQEVSSRRSGSDFRPEGD